MKNKLRTEFQTYSGGLFSSVEKADVGDYYQKLGEQGVDLMGWADPFAPDYALPDHIKQAVLRGIENESSAHYTAPIGSDALKQAIAKKLIKINNLDVDPTRNILITPGSDSGLYYSMLSVLNLGDEVMVISPSYPNNFQNCEIIGAKSVPVILRSELNYQIDIRDFEEKLTPKTKMVLLTHPNNPTTTVFNRKSLEDLAEFIIKNDLILVCDQAFEDFTFENSLITPASIEGMWDRTISVFSVSKGMGLSGFRVAYVVTNDIMMDALYGAAVSVIGATNTVFQNAVIEGFNDPSFMNAYAESYDYRRHKAFEILNQIPGVSLKLPESGFLCWLDVSSLGNASDINEYLIKNAKVCANVGDNYGPGGEGHIRIVLGVYKDDQRIVRALERIKEALTEYGKEIEIR